jgi:16S rRNA (cytosine1407-C5)-methyltransferase
LMNNNGTLIANEIQLDRVKMLVYNLDRMNIINTGVVHSKGEMLSKIYEEQFDKILVDAPCSGLGIIQKKGEVSNWWSIDRAERLGDLQTRLLIAAIKMLKVGGEVVYSTCTLTIEENELVLNTILNKYPVEAIEMDLPVKSHEAFTSFKDKSLNQNLSMAKRIFPWEVDSDGFFMIKLRKTGSTNSPDKIIPKKRDLKIVDIKNKDLRKTFSNLKDDFGLIEDIFSIYKFLLKGNDIFFVTKEWSDDNLGLFQRIGTKFGSVDHKGQVVLHTNAAQILQDEITKNVFTIEEHDDLKKYLGGAIIKKDFGSPGQCVIKYQDYILGTAVSTSQGIKSRFPRAKRTQEILI